MTTEIVRRPSNISLEQQQEWAEWAHGVQAEISEAIDAGRSAYWQLAEALYRFEEAYSEKDEQGEVQVRGRGWRALLGSEATLEDWLAQPEVGLSRSTYYGAIAAWKELAIYRKIKPETLIELDPSKVEIILPSLKRGHLANGDALTTTEALGDARVLGQRDLRDKYYGERQQIREDSEDDDATSADPDDEDDASVPSTGHEDEGTDAVTAGDDEDNLATTPNGTSGHLSRIVAEKLAEDGEPLTPSQAKAVSAILSHSPGTSAPDSSSTTPDGDADGGGQSVTQAYFQRTADLEKRMEAIEERDKQLMVSASSLENEWQSCSRSRLPKALDGAIEAHLNLLAQS